MPVGEGSAQTSSWLCNEPPVWEKMEGGGTERKGQRQGEGGGGQEMTGQRQKDGEGRHSSGCLCVCVCQRDLPSLSLRGQNVLTKTDDELNRDATSTRGAGSRVQLKFRMRRGNVKSSSSREYEQNHVPAGR